MKYIPAEKLIAELRRQKRELELSIQSKGDFGQSCQIVAYENILSLIDSLQQERIREYHKESWIEETKKELQHEEELLDMRLETLRRMRDKKNQFMQEQPEYVRKDMVVDAIKLAYGKISMNPFDCSDAFEELLNKIGYEIH